MLHSYEAAVPLWATTLNLTGTSRFSEPSTVLCICNNMCNSSIKLAAKMCIWQVFYRALAQALGT